MKAKLVSKILVLTAYIQIYGTPSISLGTIESLTQELYMTYDQSTFSQPHIKVIYSTNQVAGYYPKSNTIKIEEKALWLCASLEKDSLNGLAFIIGHEMTHAAQSAQEDEAHVHHFLKYSRNYKSSVRDEKTADIHGAFTSYLVGYKNARVIPRLINLIYNSYDLKEKELSAYPSLKERSICGDEAVEIAERLVQYHRLANYLSLLDLFELSSQVYNLILEYYAGPEIYYNIGMNRVLEAMTFSIYNVDIYAYPFEIEVESRLTKPPSPSGAKGLSMEESKKRKQLLSSARVYFERSALGNYNLLNRIVMLASIDLLQEDPNAAILRLKSASNSSEQSKLLLGISYASLNTNRSVTKADSIFNSLLSSSARAIRSRAKHNREVMQGRDYNCIELAERTELNEEYYVSLQQANLITDEIYRDKELVLSYEYDEQFELYKMQYHGKIYLLRHQVMTSGNRRSIDERVARDIISMGNQSVYITRGKRKTLEFIDEQDNITHLTSILY